MPALVGSAPNGGYPPLWQPPGPLSGGHPQKTVKRGGPPPPAYLPTSQSHQPHMLRRGEALELPLGGPPTSSNGFGSGMPLMCRRQKGFYVLLTLLILGVLILVFIVVSSAIIYITHINRYARRPVHIRRDPCASLDCYFGAECAVDSSGREGRCKCNSVEDSCPQHQSSTKKNLVDTVCGSNGVSYSSECQLRVASCSLQTSIYVKNKGSCDNKGLVGSHSSSTTRGGSCEGIKCEFGSMCTATNSGSGGGGPSSAAGRCLCPENCLDYPQVREYFESSLSQGLPGATGSHVVLGDLDPFCGSDGIDYKNICELKRTSCQERRDIQVKFRGKCDPCSGSIRCPGNQICGLDENRNPVCKCSENKCSLSLDSGPVCGSDGRTYPNACFLEDHSCRNSKNIRIISRGECKEGSHPCLQLNCSWPLECNVDRFGVSACVCPPPCPKVYRPVCGSDQLTYDSFCHLQRKSCLSHVNVTLLYIGTCDNAGLTELARGPTCSKDTCHFGGICIKDEATREVKCVCSSCPDDQAEPVCGSDHVSYSSECHLQRTSCQQQKAVQVAYRGLCRGCEELQCKHYAVCEINFYGISECICPQVCIRVDAPVCGSDGVTYDNECDLRVRSCKLQIKLTVKTVGPCDACQTMNCKHGARCEGGRCVCPSNCPTGISEPLCANDGTTYANECELRKVACLNEMDLRALFYGECEDADEPAGHEAGFAVADVGSGGGEDSETDTQVQFSLV